MSGPQGPVDQSLHAYTSFALLNDICVCAWNIMLNITSHHDHNWILNVPVFNLMLCQTKRIEKAVL